MAGIKDGDFIRGDDLHSFLMIGQSNMAGRGEFADVPPIDNFRCYMLRNGRFLKMREPINPDRPIFEGKFHSGISLAASFADEFARENKARIGLIPCADGGTGIDQWMPGEILYDHAVFMAKLAMRTSKFSGFLWHQGESDCVSDEKLDAYKEKLINFILSIRRDLGAKELPFIIGELSENISSDWNIGNRAERMNAIFHQVAMDLPMCGVASSTGLSLKDDGVHFNSVSLREFGKRYFEVYKGLVRK
jgi:hypothetical protein